LSFGAVQLVVYTHWKGGEAGCLFTPFFLEQNTNDSTKVLLDRELAGICKA